MSNCGMGGKGDEGVYHQVGILRQAQAAKPINGQKNYPRSQSTAAKPTRLGRGGYQDEQRVYLTQGPAHAHA